MWQRIIVPGLFGGVAMVIWGIVVNGVFGFKASIDMKQVSNERHVYEVLKETISEPGRYVCNPALTDSGIFPDGEPVFSIVNGGMGHEAAGAIALFQLLLFFTIPTIAVWMLTRADGAILSSYPQKLLFFATAGLLIGVTRNLSDFGIGAYPLDDAILLTLHDVLLWTVAGLGMAWRIRPETA
jgi:hypothetical protein